MELIAQVSFSGKGKLTGTQYDGIFQVRTCLTRREQFTADQKRREIIGPMTPEAAMPALVGEAFMLGQLSVRILEAPGWWRAADGGLDLRDANIIDELFRKVLDTELKATDATNQQAAQVAKELIKTT